MHHTAQWPMPLLGGLAVSSPLYYRLSLYLATRFPDSQGRRRSANDSIVERRSRGIVPQSTNQRTVPCKSALHCRLLQVAIQTAPSLVVCCLLTTKAIYHYTSAQKNKQPLNHRDSSFISNSDTAVILSTIIAITEISFVYSQLYRRLADVSSGQHTTIGCI